MLFLFYKHSLKVKWNNLLFSNYTFYKVPHFDQGIIVYICFDETFRKFINFINCPLTEKVWENPVYGTFNLYLPYAFFSACVLFI
jgi:hypothetical protein